MKFNTTTRIYAALSVALTFIGLHSCVHSPLTGIIDPIDTLVIVDTDTIVLPPLVTCSEDTAYFTNDVLPILVSSCAITGCHDAETHEEGIVLSTWNSIMASDVVKPGDPGDSELFEKLFDSDPEERMPPAPYAPLTAQEIAILNTWVLQGALNNSCDDCDTSDVTYSGIVSTLISAYCTGCHGDVSPSASLSLTSYENVAFSANNGSLMSSLFATDGYSLMPYGSSPLPDCRIEQIQLWVDAGAPNN
ncbi:MAG TPA: hypothetical protein DHW15_03325 [Bacteroidetes bacterium]|jgi:hypothetical protein|nr:MAG: hypothetical protein ABR94_06105 [Sphingobacteriales bacterium BACL12 MAG-120802-bin5]KRP10973.1 MAG: hypothetical protein ABR95_09885 [Sphingobacteriales bacterium BACL12 MAG-120813-bin55]HCK21209.1 hypothetical protein [Bacteroidota bacterium]